MTQCFQARNKGYFVSSLLHRVVIRLKDHQSHCDQINRYLNLNFLHEMQKKYAPSFKINHQQQVFLFDRSLYVASTSTSLCYIYLDVDDNLVGQLTMLLPVNREEEKIVQIITDTHGYHGEKVWLNRS